MGARGCDSAESGRRSTAALTWGQVSYLDWCPDSEPAGTIVLLHGGGIDSAALSWGEMGPALADAGYRVIAPDHPGYGRSPAPPWLSTQERLVAYVGEFIDALELDRYTLGGLSLGGGMTIGHLLRHSGKVSGAVLLDSYGIMPRLSDGPLSLCRQAFTCALVRTGELARLSRRLARNPAALNWSIAALIRDPAARTPHLLAQVHEAVREDAGFDQFAQWQRDQVGWTRLRTDYTDRLPRIGVPTLIVHGARDNAVPVAHARNAARLIPGAQLSVVPDAGHWVQRDRPSAVLAAISDFLAAV